MKILNWEGENWVIKTKCPYFPKIKINSTLCHQCKYFVKDLGGQKVSYLTTGQIECEADENETN